MWIATMKLRSLLCIAVVYGLRITQALEFHGDVECENETDFMCRSDKKCIDSALMCNKKFDCEDRSDEEGCSKCITHYYNMNFIKFQWRVSKICGSWLNSMKFLGCDAPDWFECKDGTCISSSLRCNGQYDCPSEDDEDPTKCDHYVAHHEIIECTKDEFKCGTDGVCIPLELVCDKVSHCLDGSDETTGCEVLRNKCTGFTCRNGHCLTDMAWVCDR